MRDTQQAVASVVGALLILSVVVSFMATYELRWRPVMEADAESQRADELRAAFTDLAATSDIVLAQGAAGRAFAGELRFSESARVFADPGPTQGTVSVTAPPTLTVASGGSTLAHVEGGLRVDAAFTRQPQQTLAYAFGAVERAQDGGAWTDLRSVLGVARAPEGQVDVRIQAMGVEGAPQSVSTTGAVRLTASLVSATNETRPESTIDLTVDEVHAAAWRQAVNRTFGEIGLPGEFRADCAASTAAFCFPAAQNSDRTLHVTFGQVRPAWTLVAGTLRVDVSA